MTNNKSDTSMIILAAAIVLMTLIYMIKITYYLLLLAIKALSQSSQSLLQRYWYLQMRTVFDAFVLNTEFWLGLITSNLNLNLF